MHVEQLNLPEHLLGAQCANAFVSIMQLMLEDQRHTFCKGGVQSIFTILSALFTNGLMDLIKCDDMLPTPEHSLH